jgi:serine/threonine protein kinase
MNKGYDSKKDIWAVGCILYLMLAMSPPFTANSDEATIEKIKIGKCNMKS